jgi:naked cuticle
MKQVVRWLEQEFSSSLNTTEKLNAKNAAENETKTPHTSPPRTTKQPHSQTLGSPKRDEAPNSPSASSSVERHEHHHVHEHIHHHYHHYQETPVLV